jgi:hypothetical protein
MRRRRTPCWLQHPRSMGPAKGPFRETDRADHPLTLYAASKNAHAYSHLFKIPVTMLRLFTIYGPWSRPDMALFKFAAALFEGRPIDVCNHGKMSRDFTYIDDLIEAMLRLLSHAPPLPEVHAPPLAEDSLSLSRPGGSSISAPRHRSRSWISSPPSGPRPEYGPGAISWRCSKAMCQSPSQARHCFCS